MMRLRVNIARLSKASSVLVPVDSIEHGVAEWLTFRDGAKPAQQEILGVTIHDGEGTTYSVGWGGRVWRCPPFEIGFGSSDMAEIDPATGRTL